MQKTTGVIKMYEMCEEYSNPLLPIWKIELSPSIPLLLIAIQNWKRVWWGGMGRCSVLEKQQAIRVSMAPECNTIPSQQHLALHLNRNPLSPQPPPRNANMCVCVRARMFVRVCALKLKPEIKPISIMKSHYRNLLLILNKHQNK
jgi:hypothetical protein